MNFAYTFITICWIVFAAFWVYSSFAAKRTIRGNRSWLVTRIVMVAFFYALFATGAFVQLSHVYHPTEALRIMGAAMVGMGIAFCIWARVNIGRNWGMPMSVKENPELVTSGPYAYVRHPIYSGALFAMFGSAIATGLPWLIVLIAFFIYFSIAARTEEKLMLKQFPDVYPAYMQRTKMLVPFIF